MPDPFAGEDVGRAAVTPLDRVRVRRVRMRYPLLTPLLLLLLWALLVVGLVVLALVIGCSLDGPL